LQPIVDDTLANNQQSVEDYQNGKNRAFGYLMGQIMKQTHGKANPQIVTKLLKQSLTNM
jgi:aspartyl-tRNA(Asn)/glutamyl-tRNA(Gln) amidotransferase subunit B